MKRCINLTQHRPASTALPNLNKVIFRFILLIFIYAVATPALADYIGPQNRVVTATTSACKIVLNSCQYVPAKDDYRYHKVNEWSCSNEAKPWKDYPDQPSSQGCFAATTGDQYWERVETVQEVTTTYPPATISSSLQNCALSNGWCITPPRLVLSGSEPIPDQSITVIEGTLNGQRFACSGASCTVPLNQGNNNFTYWALSSWSDSSLMGALTTKVDSQPPNLTGTLTGTLGLNGWYTEPVSFTSNATDATSGLASFTCTLDGVALVSCHSIDINTDGPHTIVLTARDNAGKTTVLSQNVSSDTQNPVMNAVIQGTRGSNDWYTAAELNASASDPVPGSGLAALEYNLDASSWTTFPVSGVLTLPDGKHSVDVRAADTAGRTVLSSKSFWLDTVVPNVLLEPAGTLGLNDWYTTPLKLAASASDIASGIDLLEYKLNNNAWTTYQAPLTFTDGTHSLSFWAQDFAGLASQVNRTYKVDTRPPQLAGSLSGISGTNGWYISNVTLSASAADPALGSGIDAFTYILNGDTETEYSTALTLSDGQHTLQFNAKDKAGLSYSTQQTIKVDTVYPSLNVQTTLPTWIQNNVVLNGTAGDSGSELSRVEISTDGGQTWHPAVGTTSWGYTWDTQNSLNGIRDVHVRAIDNAGLITKRSFSAGVDNRGPKISLPDSWYQWDTVTLDIWDDESGLSEARVEISDPEGRWPARIIRLGLGRFPLDFKWDRRFGDDTVAPLGVYNVRVVAFDKLGNMARESASIKIMLGILPAGPTSTLQPSTRPLSTSTLTPTPVETSSTSTPTAIVSVFGAIEPTAQITPTIQVVQTPRATPVQSSVLDWLESLFVPDPNATEHVTELISSKPVIPSRSPTPQSNVLWGAAAAGVVGAATAYALEEKRQREEEQARQAEEVRERVDAKNEAYQASQEAKREALLLQNWLQGQAMLNAQIEEAKKQGATSAQIAALKEVSATQGIGAAMNGAIDLANSLYESTQRRNAAADVHVTRKEELAEAELKAIDVEQAEWVSDDVVNAYMAQQAAQEWQAGEKEIYTVPPKEKPWWEKAVDWVDENQAVIALGIGAAIGIGAVALAGIVTLPALALVAGAAILAGGTIALGTIALNAFYDRGWSENLVRNIVLAATGAAVVSGAGFLFQAAASGIGGYCAVHPSTCAQVEPIFNAIDAVELGWLNTKLAYQTWIGSPQAAETALEVHSERFDGGMPGNSVIHELGGETLEAVAKYGDEALDLIKKYGPDAAQIISQYGDDGIAMLQKYGDDGIQLLKDHGTQAIKVMQIIDPGGAEKLLETLDDDVLDYALEQGSDAVAALSRWSEDDLREHGIELALRAQKDAEVLADVKKLFTLRPINPARLTKEQQDLIDKIAEHSTQYANEGQVVLGKWVDFGSGFVETAQNTGSVHYNPHPDMWNLLGDLGKENRSEVAWLINKQVIQTGIDQGLPFEYTLNGVPADTLDNEDAAIQAIFSGKTDAEIMRALKSDYIPIRMKELQELQKAGYEFSFDEATNSYVLIP